MTLLTYAAASPLKRAADEAARQWNVALRDLIELLPAPEDDAMIWITLGPVNRSKHPDRIAQCERSGVDTWRITLASDRPWAHRWWQRLLGTGFHPVAALLHELGHVWQLPHAYWPDYIMHEDIPMRGSLRARESRHYREQVLRLLENES